MQLSQKQLLEKNKLQKKLRRLVGQAIADYQMIDDGDLVMICVSGGKDSYTLVDILRLLQYRAKIRFEIVAVILDQKQPGFDVAPMAQFFEQLSIPFHCVEQNTYEVVKKLTPEGKIYCPLCSRLRRGHLYATAKRLGATKVALGHHMDDVVETFLMNMFHGSKLKGMPPKLLSDDKQHLVIRPLVYCRENWIQQWSLFRQFPIIPCRLCGTQENLTRQKMKAMLHQWDDEQPGRVRNMFRALQSVVPSHLADSRLFDFATLESGGGKGDRRII